MIPSRVKFGALWTHDADLSLNPRAVQNVRGPAAVCRVGVGRAPDDPGKARREDGVGARGSSAVGGAWFKRHVKRGSACIRSRLQPAQCLDFSVRLAGGPMPPPGEQLPATNDHRADGGVGVGSMESPPGRTQRFGHPSFVVRACLRVQDADNQGGSLIMQLSFRSREHLYRGLATLLESGLTFSQSLSALRQPFGGLDAAVKRMEQHAETAAGAFRSLGGAIDENDTRLIAAAESAGRLVPVLQDLADLYEVRAKARAQTIQGLLYPMFLLHMGILLIAAPRAVSGGFDAYLQAILRSFAMVYGFFAVVVVCFLLFRWAIKEVGVFDRFLRAFPVVGPWFSDPADARFCYAFALQIRSGIPILRALEESGAASGRAYLRTVCRDAAEKVKAGCGLADAVMGVRWSSHVTRAIQVGEKAGRLDEQLGRSAALLSGNVEQRRKLLAEWIPRFVYVGVLIAMGIEIVGSALGTFQSLNNALNPE